MSIGPLPPPNAELASRLLEQVPYQQSFIAGQLLPRVGLRRVTVRSLPQLRNLLAPEGRGMPGIDLEDLIDWVRTVHGDHSLAGALAEVAQEPETSYMDRCHRSFAIVDARIAQAKEVPQL